MKRGLLTKKRLALFLPLALGAFSVLIFGGTRRLFFFNLQQIVPARTGSTYFSIWHVPESCFTRDVMRPCWRRWPKEYERRKEDWRIHAARAFLPSEVWMAEERADAYDAVEDSLREYEAAIRLAPDRACLFAGKAIVLLKNHACSIFERLKYVNGANVIDSQWKPSELDATGVASIRQALEMSKKVDPNNGFPLLLEARLLFAQGKDDEAVQAVAAARGKKETVNHGLELSRNLQEFLTSMGALRLEARKEAPNPKRISRAGAWGEVPRDVARVLLAMGRTARTSGDHAAAVKLFHLGAYAMRSGHEHRIASILALLRISPASREERQEERVAAATDYLRRHGADGLAERLETGYERHRQHLEDSRSALLGLLVSYAALFGAALLLFQMVLLGLPGCAMRLLRRGAGKFDCRRVEKAGAHGASLLLVLMVTVIGLAGSINFFTHISYSGPAPEPPQIVLWSLLCLAVFVLVASLSYRSQEKTLVALIREMISHSSALLREYAVPCALLYCGYAYVVLVWIAYFLREWATPLL